MCIVRALLNYLLGCTVNIEERREKDSTKRSDIGDRSVITMLRRLHVEEFYLGEATVRQRESAGGKEGRIHRCVFWTFVCLSVFDYYFFLSHTLTHKLISLMVFIPQTMGPCVLSYCIVSYAPRRIQQACSFLSGLQARGHRHQLLGRYLQQ